MECPHSNKRGCCRCMVNRNRLEHSGHVGMRDKAPFDAMVGFVGTVHGTIQQSCPLMALILHPSVAWPEPRDVMPLYARSTSSGVSDDIAFAIMGFLDAVSLLAVGSVCKTWKAMHNYGAFVVLPSLPPGHYVTVYVT